MYLQPIKHKLLSIAGMAVDPIEDACSESWVVEPVLQQTVPTALYLPSDLERVTASWEGTTIEKEVAKLEGGVREHAATMAYRFRDAAVVDGAVYSGRWRERVLDRKLAQFEPEPGTHRSSGTLACTYSGNHFFGHWITDDLTIYLAAEQVGNPFLMKRKPYLHEPPYRKLVDIHCESVTRATFDELILLRDFGQNLYKRKRYETLRSRLRAQFEPAKAKRVLLRRGNLGQSRAIVNAAEFEAFLSSQGFSIVEPETLTPAQIVAELMGAEVVIGVEGSQIPHALLTMAEGGVLFCLQPPNRFNNTIRGYTDCLNMQYAILVGHAAPGGFSIDLNDLKRMLDRIDKALAAPEAP